MTTKINEFEINGAKIAVYPMQGVRTIVARVKIRTGSWYEEGKDWGAMHLLEHMSFQGTKKFATQSDIEIFREENAISKNAFTGGPSIEYVFRFPDLSLESGFELLEECVFFPTFPEDRLEKEKKIVRQEYLDKWSSKDARFGKAVRSQLYGEESVYFRDGLGVPDYVDQITREDLIKIHAENFVPANMVIGIAGAVDAGKVKKILERILDKKQGIKKELKIEKIKHGDRKLIHKEDGVEAVTAYWMWMMKGDEEISYEDGLKLSMARYILGGGLQSVIMRKLRQELGLVYKAGWATSELPTTGTFEAWASVAPENLEQVELEVRKIYKEFLEIPIDSNIFARANKYLDLQTLMGLDSVDGIAGSMTTQLFWEGRTYSAEEIIDIASKFTEADIRDAVKRNVLGSEPYVAMMVGKK